MGSLPRRYTQPNAPLERTGCVKMLSADFCKPIANTSTRNAFDSRERRSACRPRASIEAQGRNGDARGRAEEPA